MEQEKVWKCTFPEGRQPLALLCSLIGVQLLQHHTRVLSCQVVLQRPTHIDNYSMRQQHNEHKHSEHICFHSQGFVSGRPEYSPLSSRTCAIAKRIFEMPKSPKILETSPSPYSRKLT